MRRAFPAILTLVVAAGCSSPTQAPTPTQAPLFAAIGTPSPVSAATPQVTAVGSATSQPRPTSPAACEDSASFIEDLTIPDGTEVLPGESLDKRWSVRNTGSCDWGPEYRLVQVGTSDIRGPEEIALYPAAAGSAAVWRVALLAPELPGEYLGRWQARAPDGTLFGDEVFVLIVVAEPEPTATTPATATP